MRTLLFATNPDSTNTELKRVEPDGLAVYKNPATAYANYSTPTIRIMASHLLGSWVVVAKIKPNSLFTNFFRILWHFFQWKEIMKPVHASIQWAPDITTAPDLLEREALSAARCEKMAGEMLEGEGQLAEGQEVKTRLRLLLGLSEGAGRQEAEVSKLKRVPGRVGQRRARRDPIGGKQSAG